MLIRLNSPGMRKNSQIYTEQSEESTEPVVQSNPAGRLMMRKNLPPAVICERLVLFWQCEPLLGWHPRMTSSRDRELGFWEGTFINFMVELTQVMFLYTVLYAPSHSGLQSATKLRGTDCSVAGLVELEPWLWRLLSWQLKQEGSFRVLFSDGPYIKPNAIWGASYCTFSGMLVSYELASGELAVMNLQKSYVRQHTIAIINTMEATSDFKVEMGYVCGSGTQLKMSNLSRMTFILLPFLFSLGSIKFVEGLKLFQSTFGIGQSTCRPLVQLLQSNIKNHDSQ